LSNLRTPLCCAFLQLSQIAGCRRPGPKAQMSSATPLPSTSSVFEDGKGGCRVEHQPER
jgi:hypothetical protein